MSSRTRGLLRRERMEITLPVLIELFTRAVKAMTALPPGACFHLCVEAPRSRYSGPRYAGGPTPDPPVGGNSAGGMATPTLARAVRPPAAVAFATLVMTLPGRAWLFTRAVNAMTALPPGASTWTPRRSVRPSHVAPVPAPSAPGSSSAGRASITTTWRAEAVPRLLSVSVNGIVAPSQAC